jgi:hypothetical protein
LPNFGEGRFKISGFTTKKQFKKKHGIRACTSVLEALRVSLQLGGGGALRALEPCDIHNVLLNSLANDDISVFL